SPSRLGLTWGHLPPHSLRAWTGQLRRPAAPANPLPRVGGNGPRWHGTINPLSIAYGYHALGLGPANPTRTYLASEPSGFRRPGFPPGFSLLIPASALPRAPPGFPPRLHRPRDAPLPKGPEGSS